MSVSLNGAGKSHAMALINSGKVDKDSSWSMSADDENKLLGDNNWSEYGKWFLGIDASADPKTKAHYKYPFGKGGKLYRSALTAIRQRAGQQGADAIFAAAGNLLEKIDGKKEGDSITPPKMERRAFPFQEIRVTVEDGKATLRGHAAVFNSLSLDLGGFRETIMPGAFRSALLRCDYRSMFNHNPDKILGRKSAGTLRATEDGKGVPYEVDLPDTSYARDLQVSMGRGDVKECSFGFSVREGGDCWLRDASGEWTRSIQPDGIDELYDLSPVVFPAYPDTACAMRSLEKVQAALVPPFDDTELRRLRLELESTF